jgi:MFS family permease
MDRQVFPVLLPHISRDYGFSLSEGGWLSTIFTLGIGVAGIPGAYLLSRFSRKLVIIMGIAIYSLFTILTALSTFFVDMFVYRALSGVGEAIQNAALFSAVGAYFFTHRALAIGSMNFAYGVGAFLGPRSGARLAVDTGHWQTPFFTFGGIGIIFIIIIALFISKRFTDQTESEAQGVRQVDYAQTPTNLYNRNVWLFALGGSVAGLAGYGYLGLYPTFLENQLHFSTIDAGTAAGMFGLGALMGIPAGLIGDKLSQRWVLIVSFVALAVIGYMLFNGPTGLVSQSILSFLEGTVGSGFLFTNTYSVLQRSVRPALVGRVSGIFVTFWYFPSAFAGFIFAVLHNKFGWSGASIIQLGLLPFVAVVLLLFARTSRLTRVTSGTPSGVGSGQ